MKVIQIECLQCLGKDPNCDDCGGWGVKDEVIKQTEEQENYDRQLDEHIKNGSWGKPE